MARRAGAAGPHEELCREYGTTILMTTHLMEEADHLCRRVAIMHQGRVASTGTPTADFEGVAGRRYNTSLDDVFVHYAGGIVDSGGGYC